jgi:hypothetical protein
MKISLSSGREITLSHLEQWRAYAGLLAGMPNREMNGRVIEDARSRALQHGLEGAAPVLVPPRLKPVERKPASAEYLMRTGMTAEQSAARDQQMHYEQLPAVVCVAVFNSDGLTKPDAEPMSSLTLIWFQDDFALPVDAGVLAHIQALDWETLATEWCW